MAFKFVVFAACVAAANAGLAPLSYAAPAYTASAYASPLAVGAPAISSVSQNTLRSFGNVGQVSTYSKSLDTPYSSVRKSDIRVTNDARTYATYAAPAYTSYAAPAYTSYAAPAVAHATYAAPAVAHATYAAPAISAHPAALGVAYSAAPAVAHYSFDGLGAHYAY
ncbi:cuticle protein 76-like [Cloeon dipterum]|uniref:cuticle protein 76-like n=1 Tax=Cloeon dipterum TaxID=197152 RepID=UPI00321FE4C5